MKDFSRKFYHSKAWLKVREQFFRYKFGLCNRCSSPGKIVHHIIELTPKNIGDPAITLSFSNLELLCHKCHDGLRHDDPALRVGYEFDESGRVVEKKPL